MGAAWEGGEYASQFGKAASFYPPVIKDIDRHPDKRPSDGAWEITPFEPGRYIEVQAVRQCGVTHFTLTNDLITGRLTPVGMSCFSAEMLQFGLEAEPECPTRK
jgi:hypothetical protein